MEKKYVGWIVICCFLTIALQDQMRWQPWTYLYFLMLLPFLFEANKKLSFVTLQWILAGVYLWSGIHKINQSFLDSTYNQLFDTLGLSDSFEKWKLTGYIIPAIEIATGIGLLIPGIRKIALYAAITTHLLILFYLSPVVLNHNSVVYPWNVAMIIFDLLLFHKTIESYPSGILQIRSSPLLLVPVLLIWIFPLLNFTGRWDHYLSFSLYSNKPAKYYIAIEEGEVIKLDKRYGRYFADVAGLQGGKIIDIDRWSYEELNVPFYPEMRLFKKISRNFCETGINHEKLAFLEFTYSNGKPVYNNYTCDVINHTNH